MGVKVRFYRGAWWIFIDHQGRRKAKKIGDRETALRIAQTLRARLARAELHLPVDATSPTLRTYVGSWMATAATNLKASTIGFYQGHLNQHILPALGDRLVSDLRRADCRDFVTLCRGKGLKVATVRGIARR